MKFLILLSYALALVVLGFFYLLASSPYSMIFALALISAIFINGLLDEVMGELTKLRKLKSDWYSVLRNADMLIVFGAIYYLGSGPYDFLKVYSTVKQNLFLGGAIVLGIILVNYTHRRASRGTGLDTSSERMFLLGIFAAAGYYNYFKAALFSALAALCALLYLSVLRDVWKIRGISFAPLRHAAGATYSYLAQTLRSICSAARKRSPARPKLKVKQPSLSVHNFTAVVTEAKTEAPLPNATVTLASKETGKKEVRYADASGRGDFSVPEGQYKIVIEAKGFKKEEYERFISIDSGEVFKLSRPSVDLSVVVNDAQVATPISGASVTLKIREKEQVRRTDNLGVAYFDNIEPQLCEVFVEAGGYERETGSVNLEKENIISFNLSNKNKVKNQEV
ncbi:MAG: carboxypeptidase regulatory-like domain-containing protein [Euryarchaeota archaeon]|nr:carboxypeptidase regulatory-like domain-containing protein [Euryarchaeota archaeon]